jgi:hypothetical protein
LAAAPYGLAPGEPIIARVYAKNSYGMSPPSLPNKNSLKLFGIPSTPETPNLELESKNFLVLNWNPIDRAEKTEIYQTDA